ncbi:MAG TPA: bifunctional ornithine acetyltransferase/N-acetylglutamate synthase, partial [Caulobacterales bacterium]|nr:bifunctional ornithine acetyltransferase/N-acetylglutamate synthase [Caulobacterales bacterium]
DGDRSTNDCVLLMATGAAKVPPIADANDPRLADFRAALSRVLADLAIQIVRDGEGATKFVAVRITGATNDLSAKRIARTICESPLVKTAIAGEDANWGRIVAAAGRADQPMQRELMSVRFGELWAAKDGMVAPDYDEAAMSAYMKRPELEITVNVGPGMGTARMYTCDLTKRYVEINGDYRS